MEVNENPISVEDNLGKILFIFTKYLRWSVSLLLTMCLALILEGPVTLNPGYFVLGTKKILFYSLRFSWRIHCTLLGIIRCYIYATNGVCKIMKQI